MNILEVISNPFLGGKIPKKFGVTSNSYSLQRNRAGKIKGSSTMETHKDNKLKEK